MNLRDILIREIKQNGPISLSYFMHKCLMDERFGYYQTQEIFGRKGDFITAPELSQIFTEIICLYAIFKYQQQNEPNKFNIIEFGPGRGTLMHDFLLTAQKFPKFFQSLHIYLIESSQQLQKQQTDKLQKFAKNITHIESIKEIEARPGFIIANEFFDALPILQFEFQDDNWYERKIDFINNEFKFCLTKSKESLLYPSQFLHNRKIKKNDIFELSPAALTIFNDICDYCSASKASALIIDYAYSEYEFNNTLQALYQHKYHNLFENLGQADITAYVNFALFKQIAKDRKIESFCSNQKYFLESLGIHTRVEMVEKNKSISHKTREAVEILTSPDKMGDIFKVLQLS